MILMAFVALCLAGVALHLRRGRPFWPSPYLALAALLLLNIVKLLYLRYGGPGGTEILRGKGPETLAAGGLALSLAAATFYAGALFAGRLSWSRGTRWLACMGSPRIWLPLLLLLLGAAAVGFFFYWEIWIEKSHFVFSAKRFLPAAGESGSRLANPKYYCYKFASLAKLAAYFFFWFALTGTRRQRVLMGLLFLFSYLFFIFVCVVFSTRGKMVLLTLDLVLFVAVLGDWRTLKRLFPALFVTGFLFLVTSQVRNQTGHDVPWVRAGLRGGYLMDVVKTSHIIQYLQSSGVRPVGAPTFFAFLDPRMEIFAGVPFIELGRYWGKAVYDMPISGVPTGFVAELFLNCSWAGIALGMFVLGALLQTSDNTARLESSGCLRLVYVMLWTRVLLVLSNNDAATFVLEAAQDIGDVLFLLLLATRTAEAEPRPVDGGVTGVQTLA